MKFGKKIISAVTSLAVLINALPITAFADSGILENSSIIADVQAGSADVVEKYFEATKHYFYNQLNDFEKAVFKKYEQLTVENPVVTISSEEIEGYSEEEITDMCERAYTAFVTDDPKHHMIWERWWNSISFTNDGVSIKFDTITITSDNQLKIAENRIVQIKNAVGTDGDLYTRVRKLWQLFQQNMDYNYYYLIPSGPYMSDYTDCALGCFNKNVAVCAGFSDAFKIMCDELEIPCIVVANAGHQWNYVQMDDGNWYVVDTSICYGDGKYYLKNFLIGSSDENYIDNSNYFISELRLKKLGDFSFPTLCADTYVYNGSNTDFSTSEKINDIEIDEYEYVVNEDGLTCTLTNYFGEQSGDLIVPETIDGYTVTAIGQAAYYNCRGFTGSVVIPDTVKIIDENAFTLCVNLSGTLSLPNKLEIIERGSFAGCKKLSGTLTFSDTLTKIGISAFFDCAGFTGDLVLPGDVYLGEYAFCGCNSLNGTCVLPVGIFPGYLQDLFAGCKFKAYDVPDNDPNYSDYDGALYSKDFTELILCPYQKTGELKMPDTLITIKQGACSNCVNLTSVIIPQSVTNIESDAFSYCSNLEKVTFDNSAASIGDYAFFACSKLTEFDLGNSVTSIGNCAFSSCNSLESLTIPGSVKDINTNAFGGCEKLEAVNVGESNTCYASVDGVLFNKTLTDLLFYPAQKSEISYIIPESVTTIRKSAFSNSENLENVIIGENVNQIDDYAFQLCLALKTITIPDSVTIIGSSAFGNCNLTDIYYTGSEAEWDKISIDEGNGCLSSATIHYNYLASECEHIWENGICTICDTNCSHSGGTATCTNKAKCETCSSEYGSIDSSNHTNVSDVWSNDETSHWHICDCGKVDFAAHISGGEATETEDEICTICKYVIAPATGHTADTSKWLSDGANHWHQCTGCEEKMDITAHSGGTATCTNKAKCEICSSEYGNVDSSNHTNASDVWSNDETSHWHICDCGKVDFAAHISGGEATETEDEICTICKYVISPATGHTADTSKWLSDGANHWHQCTGCEEKLDITAHVSDGGIVTTPSSDTKIGIKTYSCTVCGHVIKTEVIPTTPSKPTNVKALSGGGNATITWDKVSNATSYRVFRSTSLTGTRTLEKVRTSTYYIDTNVDTGKTYYYWILAYNANTGFKSAYSSSSSVKIVDTFAKSIEIKSASVLSTSVTLKWDMIPGATSYRIYRRNDDGTRKLLYAQSMTEYKDTGLTKGKAYIYEIRAYSATTKALTAYSPKKTVRPMAAPTILTGNVKGKITWDKNAVATSYRVYRADSLTGAKKLLKPVTKTYYTDTTAVKGKTYYYFVAAYDNTTGTLSAYSNAKAIKIS